MNNGLVKTSVFVLILIGLLFSFQGLSAADVNITNSTAGGISKGVIDTPNNGELGLADGTYNGLNNSDITINKNLTIKGTSKSNTITSVDSDKPAFNIQSGYTLTLVNLTIKTNYFYSDNEIADYNKVIHSSNGSVNGIAGSLIFTDCSFINSKQTNAIVTVVADSNYYTKTDLILAYVKDSYGNNLTGDVVFYINNIFSGRVLAVNGLAYYYVNLSSGNFNVHAIYIGNGDINPKISNNQQSFNVIYTEISLFSVPIPLTGQKYYVDPLNGNDSALRDGLTPATAWKSILYAHNNAPDNSFIILQPGNYSGTGNVGITAANLNAKINMTIIGNDTNGDVFIRLSGATLFMTLKAGTSGNWRTINFYNLIIVGGTGNGKITVGQYNTVNVDSLRFENYSNSAFEVPWNQIILNINNTTFINGRGSAGAGTGLAIFGDAYGGRVITVTNSNFLDLDGAYGSAINLNGDTTTNPDWLTIRDCLFLNVYGDNIGGVIRTFSSGYANIDIYGTDFINCGTRAANHGGVFCTRGDWFNVTDSRFINCTAGNSTAGLVNGEGGVNYLHSGTGNYINVTFENCGATAGGAIYNAGTGDLWFTNCTFTDNYARTGSGGAIYNQGGTAANPSNTYIDGCTFNGNYVIANVPGGAIFTNRGQMYITNSNFTNNTARTWGGAIAHSSSGFMLVSNCYFADNTAGNATTNYGGAIGVDSTGIMNITNSTFTRNTAFRGGAIGIDATGTVNVVGSLFDSNQALASGYGGAIGTTGGTIRVNSSEFRANTAGASGYGGAVGTTAGTILIDSSNFTANIAGTFGGAIASSGTGLSTVNITNSRIIGNVAGSYGGAAGSSSTNANSRINIINSNVENNRAGTFGGAVGINNGGITTSGSNYINNTATNYGGAVGISGGVFRADNSNFTNNRAGTFGGAVVGVIPFNVNFCNFTNNSAGTNGGAIGSSDTTTGATVRSNVTSSNFEFNTANGNGSAIWATGNLVANHNRFYNNTIGGSMNSTVWTNSSRNATVDIIVGYRIFGMEIINLYISN